MTSKTDYNGCGVFIQLPVTGERLFRNQATEDILLLLARNPHHKFSVTELRDVTGHGGDTVQTALTCLESTDLIHTEREGRKKLVSANRDRFHNPEDPVLAIPQETFRPPVKAFLDAAKQHGNTVGILLFGSVARGDADRASDIDVQVIVENNLTGSRRALHDIRQNIEEQRFNGERYKLHVLVESMETAEKQGDELQDIFSEGITLYETEKLRRVREAVFHGTE